MADPTNNDQMDQFCREYLARLSLGNIQTRLIITEIRHTRLVFEILSKEYEIMIRDDDQANEQPSIQDLQNSVDQLKLEESRLLQEKEELNERIDRMKRLIE